MHQNYWRKPERVLARAAGAHLARKVLHEPIGKMVRGAGTTCDLGAASPAMRTHVFNAVFQGIAIQRGPARQSDTNCFYGRTAHDSYLDPHSEVHTAFRRAKWGTRCTIRLKTASCC